MIEVRRPDDDELCGHVVERDGVWVALTVFGAVLGTHPSHDAAATQLLDEGLAALADRWMLRAGDSDEAQVVCIQEANTDSVTVALDYYSLPGVPTLRIARTEIAAGDWVFER